MPASSNATVIPAPMVPAPITAASSSGRTGVDAVTPSTFPAVRSAKNACLRPFDSGVSISSTKARRSIIRPSSNGPAAASIAVHRAQWGRQHGSLLTQLCPSLLAQHREPRLDQREVAGSGVGRLRRGRELHGLG